MDNSVLRRWNSQVMRAFGIFAFPLLAQVSSADVNLYVSTAGKDTWSGTLASPNATKTDGPKATILAAQSALRTLKARRNPAGTVYVVNVASGIYPVKSTLNFDDGDATTQTIYRSSTAGGAVLDGSIAVSGWTLPSATLARRLNPKVKPYIVAVNLKKLGLTNFGTLPEAHWSGDSYDVPSSYNELYVNGARQTIARWPNTGYARVTAGGGNTAFQADLSTCRAAANDPDLNIYSFALNLDWAFQSLPAAVNLKRNTVSLPKYGAALSWDSQAGGRFFLRNSLEELDTPGEYYVDRASGTLLYYPKAGYLKSDVQISMNVGAMLNFDHARNTTFQGFVLRDGRGDATRIYGGDSIAFVGCSVTNMGGYAFRTYDTTNLSVQSCTIKEMGEGGVRMDGAGDMVNLTPSNNVVQNCRIQGLGRLVPSYRPAVLLQGVGNSALHNEISDIPHEAIHIGGNNLTVEGNKISNVCWDCSDAGAIYASTATSAINRGNVIRGNVISDVKNKIGTGGIWGIYLDNRASGFEIQGNIVKNTDVAMILNGGRDIHVRNNVILDCPTAFQVDDASHVDYQGLVESLAMVPYQNAAWSQNYPNLVNILSDDPTYAKYNVFSDNVVVNSAQTINLRSSTIVLTPTDSPTDKNALGWNGTVTTSTTSGLFVNAALGDYTPVVGSVLSQTGFQPVTSLDAGVAVDTFIKGSTTTN